MGNWTRLDQSATPAARTPQDSQHIGGHGLGDGDTVNAPIQVVQGDQNPDGTGGTDNNDTAAFVIATAQAAPGSEFNAASGAVNRGTAQIEIGDQALDPMRFILEDYN